jgi:hypothetical protein
VDVEPSVETVRLDAGRNILYKLNAFFCCRSLLTINRKHVDCIYLFLTTIRKSNVYTLDSVGIQISLGLRQQKAHGFRPVRFK